MLHVILNWLRNLVADADALKRFEALEVEVVLLRTQRASVVTLALELARLSQELSRCVSLMGQARCHEHDIAHARSVALETSEVAAEILGGVYERLT